MTQLSLKERIAASKAAKEAAMVTAAPVAPAAAVSATVSMIPENLLVMTPEHKPEPTQYASPPANLTFAQKMALKKQQAESAALATIPAPASSPAVMELAKVVRQPAPATIVPAAAVPALIAQDSDNGAEQAYADIKPLIDRLTDMSGGELGNAMLELKRSLMQNPAAVSLMLDEDIGKMVIGLRLLTGVAAEESAKPAKRGPKAVKTQALTAEQLEAAWLELDA